MCLTVEDPYNSRYATLTPCQIQRWREGQPDQEAGGPSSAKMTRRRLIGKLGRGAPARAPPESSVVLEDYRPPRMASFAALATRKRTTRLAGMRIGSPVWGLRPIRALRLTRTSLPTPGMVNEVLASRQGKRG